MLIESRDGEGNRWLTVGVSSNIIDASFEALLDAVTYKLLKASDGADALGRRIVSHPAERLGGDRLFELRLAGARPTRCAAASARCPRRARRRGTTTSRSERMKFSRRIASSSADQRIPEAVDIGEEHRLLVAAELRPGHLLDQLFQRADAAGERDERVGALEHQHFSLVHVLGDDRARSGRPSAARGSAGSAG